MKKIKSISSSTIISWLLPRVRSLVYVFSLSWFLCLYYVSTYEHDSLSGGLSFLTRSFGLTGLFLLFATLIPGIVSVLFPLYSGKTVLIMARRSLGLSAFGFSLAHALVAFGHNLGWSVASILYLHQDHKLSLVFSCLSLLVLTALAVSSISYLMIRMGRYWKMLHRLIYLAVYLSVFHAFLIGSHYVNTKSFVALLTHFLALFIFLLELLCIGVVLTRKNYPESRLTLIHNLLLFLGFLACLCSYLLLST